MSSDAYENLQFYKNICYIRRRVYKITKSFEKSHPKTVSQARDAARSAKQNIKEGYKKDSIGTYTNHLKISKGSLAELFGDLEDFFEDKLILQIDFDELSDLIRKTDYMIDKYIDSIVKLNQEGKWNKRFK